MMFRGDIMGEDKISLNCDQEFISKVVNCVNDAVGDDIKEDIKINGLITQNSTPTRIWDLVNKNLCNRMPSMSCIADITKRGSWRMVPIYDNMTGTLFTFMRESRYSELHKNVFKRNKPHYVDCLVNILNSELIADNREITLFKLNPKEQFPDKESMHSVVSQILCDLKVNEQFVKRHVLVLFNSKNFELLSIRAVVIDKYMNIVCEENWSEYIPHNVSAIMESADEFSATTNNPGRSLKLSIKANKRKERNMKVHHSDKGKELHE